MESVKPSPAPSRPSKKRGLFLLSFAVLAAVLLLCFPEASAQGALQGLTFCLGTLLPSTFPFLVLSAFCVQSGLSRWLEPLFAPVTRTLFSLPGCCGPTILLGLLGGYPAGVRGIAALYRQGSVTAGQAARMLGFCVNAGPAFTISVIGAGLYGNLWLGCLIFFSVSGASLLLGILLGGWDRLRRRKASRPEPTSGSLPASAPLPFGEALTASAADAARGMLNACCFVILFSACLSILHTAGITVLLFRGMHAAGIPVPAAASLFPLFWEIGSGAADACAFGAPLALVGGAVGFGGLCIHFQILSMASGFHPPRLPFFLSRLLHALFSAGFLLALLSLFPPFPLGEETAVFHNTASALQGGLSATHAPPLRAVAAAAALLALCIVLVAGGIRKSKGNRKIR